MKPHILIRPLPTFKVWLKREKQLSDYTAAEVAEYNALALGERGKEAVRLAKGQPYLVEHPHAKTTPISCGNILVKNTTQRRP